MSEDLWPPKMHERQRRVEQIFDRQDEVVFLRLTWPCDVGRGGGVAQTTACIAAARDDGTNNGVIQPIHLQALDDEEMLEQVVEFMVNRLSSQGDPPAGPSQAKQAKPARVRKKRGG